MADLLRWNSLGEAAEWLGHLTGKTWTLRGVLDAALIHTTQRRMQGGPSNLETAIAAALPHGHTLQAYVLNVDEGRERIERMTWLSPEARKASAVPVFTCSPRPVTLLQTDIAQLLQGGWVTLTVARNRHESEECNADGTPRYAVAIEPPATVRLEHLTIRSDHLTALGEALMAAAPRSETPAPVADALPSGKKWTDERLDELRRYRTQHGTKRAAEHFGISEARVRELLPSGKKPKATHFEGLIHRMK